MPSKHIAWMHDKDWRYLRNDPRIGRIYVQRGVLSVHLTCRQIYSESIDFIYSVPTFECFEFADAFGLSEILLPPRWEALTSLKFRFNVKEFMKQGSVRSWRPNKKGQWEEFWCQISTLPRLNRLEAHLGTTHDKMIRRGEQFFVPHDVYDTILEPLKSVCNIQTFEVHITKRLLRMDGYVFAPFRLSWHEDGDLMHLGKDGEFFTCDRTARCCALRF